MQQTNGVTTVISQEQSDLVTSATISAGGQSIKNGKSIIITNNPTNINKTKITTLITSANNSKSAANINNNNSTTTNKNNKTVPRSDVIVNLQHKINSAAKNATISQTASNQTSTDSSGNGSAPLPDVRAKQVLKEAVDAVVNSFTKHTQGYGRGEFINLNINL
jgi:hypothetical protein